MKRYKLLLCSLAILPNLWAAAEEDAALLINGGDAAEWGSVAPASVTITAPESICSLQCILTHDDEITIEPENARLSDAVQEGTRINMTRITPTSLCLTVWSTTNAAFGEGPVFHLDFEGQEAYGKHSITLSDFVGVTPDGKSYRSAAEGYIEFAEPVWAEFSVGQYKSEPEMPTTLGVDLNNLRDICSFQMSISLPIGVSVEPSDVTITSRAQTDHRLSASLKPNGDLLLTCYSTKNKPFSGDEGEILSLPLTIDCEEGLYPVQIYDIRVATPLVTALYPETVDAMVNFTNMSGLINIILDFDGDGITYDLQGRQVSGERIVPGIYIKNGKKLLIK